MLVLVSLGSTNATPAPTTVAPTAAPTVTSPPTTATPTAACRPLLDMTRQSVRANITVTVEAPDTPLANINYQADSRYVVHEDNFDVVTHYSCDEAAAAGFSCAEFERQGFSCEDCACAGLHGLEASFARSGHGHNCLALWGVIYGIGVCGGSGGWRRCL